MEVVLVDQSHVRRSLPRPAIRWVPMILPVLLAILLVSFSGSYTHAEITGSAHDFSSSGWTAGEICIPCHTPHGADSTVVTAPLWNHEPSTATYTPYTSDTLDETAGDPGPISKLCLSCHDGTIALDSFGGKTGANVIGGPALLGTDLTDDHPIGIRWNHQAIAPGFCANCHLPGGPTGKVEFYGAPGDMRIECASCHDVHNGRSLPNLLRTTTAGSELCFVCHNDKI